MANPLFSFPFEPYPTQLDFATKLYHCLHNSISGIFQSPTGTGKSLSVICAALKWVNEASGPVSYVTPSKLSFVFGDFEDVEPMEGVLDEPRVLFCTRTHTQIAQFIKEIRLTSLPKGRIVALGSKKRLCINSDALSSSDVTDYCYNLSKQASPAHRCPYKSSISDITSTILTSILDIEDMQVAGKQCQQCPYYGMRAAAEQAKVIIAPYQYVLGRAIRSRMPLANSGTVIIVDEAHNVVDTMLMCNSSERKITTLETAKAHLHEMAANLPPLESLNFEEAPAETTPEVLLAERKTMLQDLQAAEHMINRVIGAILSTSIVPPASSICLHPSAFLSTCEIPAETIMQLSDRFSNYCWSYWRLQIGVTRKGGITLLTASEVEKICNAIGLIAAFAFEPDNHRIILRTVNEKMDSITHLLVNPVREFGEILSNSKCVILTGGTLDPKEEFVKLFSSLPANRFAQYDFDHVASADSLLLSIISQGTDHRPLRLDYSGCRKKASLASICEAVLKLCEIVPNGLVCFFPSFDYLKRFAGYSSKAGYQQQFLQFKAVIYDDRKTAFTDFTREAATARGAVLFTVVRGSLSEGVNFKHEIGRCVVVIGQPFPNIREAEVKAKMEYWDREGGAVTGAVYLSNVCFKAVNQCLGRVVRDRWDYAVAVLIDVRYKQSLAKLALWTRRNVAVGKSNAQIYEEIEAFFAGKQ